MTSKRFLFIFSGLLTTVTFLGRHQNFLVLSLFLSWLMLILFTRTDFFRVLSEKIMASGDLFKIFVLMVALVVAWSMTSQTYDNAIARALMRNPQVYHLPLQALYFLFALGSSYFLFYYLSWFYLFFLEPLFSLSKERFDLTKKIARKTVCFACLLLVALLLLNNTTTVFFNPGMANLQADHQYDGWFLDVIFQTDTDPLFPNYNVFIRDVPSSRQPLFSLFAFPFVAPLYAISSLLFFIPNLYPSFVVGLQFLLVFVSAFLVYDMVKEKLYYPKLFLTFYLSTYSILVFSLIIERFIFALFYLITALYLYYYSKEKSYPALLAATGTNALSFLMICFLMGQNRVITWRQKSEFILKYLLIILALLIVFGRLPLLFYSGTLEDSARWLTLEVGFLNQLQQFSEFIFASFVFPETMIDIRLFPRYEQAIVTRFNWIGVLIIAVCLLTAIKKRKDSFVQISIYWFGVSFTLLGLLGWSTSQHNLILFSSFFSFSFVYLLYLFLEEALKKFKWRKQLIVALIVAMLLYNLYGLTDLLRFAFTYYPSNGRLDLWFISNSFVSNT